MQADKRVAVAVRHNRAVYAAARYACTAAWASAPVTTMLPEKGSPKLDCTFTPPMPADASNEASSDKDAAIIFVLVFKIYLPIRVAVPQPDVFGLTIVKYPL